MTATTSPNRSDSQGQVLIEAGRRMLPVLAARLGAAVADRAEEGIDRLADRLDDLAEHGLGRREPAAEDADDEGDEGGGGQGTLARIVGEVLAQARALIDLIVRLLAQAAAAARELAGRLRARRAPEGIDEEDDELDDFDDRDVRDELDEEDLDDTDDDAELDDLDDEDLDETA